MKKFTLLSVIFLFCFGVFAQNSDLSPNKPNLANAALKATKAWVLVFAYDVSAAGASQAGTETDGTYFYACVWNSADIYRFDINGNYLATFQVPGVTGLRDLAYDGTYFYGGASGTSIYQMDFTPGSEALVSTITVASGNTVRSIAYDSDQTGLWIANWATDIECVNMTGGNIATIPAASHGLTNIYGSAYDNITAGGPYLWLFDQGGNGLDIVQIDIATGTPTGIMKDATPDLPAGASAGGGWIQNIGGVNILGGLNQGTHNIFGYNLDILFVSNDVGITEVVAPTNDAGCVFTASEVVTVTVMNYGTSDITTDFDIAYTVNGGAAVTATVPAGTTPLVSFGTVDIDFPAIDMSATGTYDFVAYTMMGGDAVPANDTAYATVNHTDAVITINLTTDQYSGETSWELVDVNTTTVVASGAGYAPNTSYVINVCVSLADCFDFTIYDSYGDGICCAYGNGSYEVFYNTVSQGSGGAFTTDETIADIGNCGINVNEVATESISVFPNPTSGILNIINAENANVVVYNMIGEVLMSFSNINDNVDLSNLANGSYVVKVQTQNTVTTQSIQIVR